MTDLVVRKMAFQFDATVPFMWQPANPHFAMFCKAEDRLNSDADVADEAEAFPRQGARHVAAQTFFGKG
jgi:hypothetical protein